jgi:hypothetical protein
MPSSIDSPKRRAAAAAKQAALNASTATQTHRVPTPTPAAATVASVTQTSRGLGASTPVSSVTASVGTEKATTPWWRGIFGFRPKVKSTMAASPDQARIEAITPRAPALATTVKAGKRVRFDGVEVEPIPLLDGYLDQARVGRRRIENIKLEDRNTRESTNPNKRTVSPSTNPNDKVSKAAETHKDFAISEAAEEIYKDSLRKKAKKCDLSALRKFTDAELKSYLDRVLSQEGGAADRGLESFPVTEKMQLGIIAERLGKMQDYDMIAMPWNLAEAQRAETKEKSRAGLFVADAAPSRSNNPAKTSIMFVDSTALTATARRTAPRATTVADALQSVTHTVASAAAAKASAAIARDDAQIQADIASMKYHDGEYALLNMLSAMDQYYQEFKVKGYDKKKITDLMREPINTFFKNNSLNDQAFSAATASSDSFRTTDTYRELNSIMQTIYYDRPTEAPLYALQRVTQTIAPAARAPLQIAAAAAERTSSERTVIQDYWYTNAHIEDLGTQWQNAAANRLFIPISLPGAFEEELTYKTGLTQQNVNALRGPCKIMLPLNKGGNHWTAITADVTIGANGRKIVKLSFTDSLSAEREYDKLPQKIKAEMDRIGNLFRGAAVTKEIYAHTWKQPDGDGSSCGPYSIANAVRCLDGKNAEPNPGREVIRRQQLDVMTNNSAIRSCSTNNKVDEVIRSWVIDRVSKNLPYAIENHNDFLEMCQNFANYSKTPDLEKIRMIFVTENNRMGYDNVDLVLPYVRKRMGELIASDELLQEAHVGKLRRRSVVLPASVQQAPTTRPLDIIAPFEDLRKKVREELGSKGSYRFVGKIMQDLALIGVDDEALTRVTKRITKLEDEALADRCLKVVSIVQKDYKNGRSKEKYATKLAEQSETYLEIYKARKRKEALVEPIKALIEKGRVTDKELKKLGISENPSERKITTKQAVDFWHARKHEKSFAEVAKVYADALRADSDLIHLPTKQIKTDKARRR